MKWKVENRRMENVFHYGVAIFTAFIKLN